MLQRKTLIKPITIPGRNFWGAQTSIEFLPAQRPGVYLRTKSGDVPINFRIARRKKGRIELSTEGTTLAVYEHIGALRFAGIDSMIIVPKSTWPPYLGGMVGYLPPFLAKGVTEENGSFPTITPKRESSYCSHNKIDASTKIRQATTLSLLVYSKWHDLPAYREKITPSCCSKEQWSDIWNAKPQGFLFQKRVAKLLRWPNMDCVTWRDQYATEEAVSYSWWCHRVQDIFGCLSLANHCALPILHYESFCAGHKEDLLVLQQSFS